MSPPSEPMFLLRGLSLIAVSACFVGCGGAIASSGGEDGGSDASVALEDAGTDGPLLVGDDDDAGVATDALPVTTGDATGGCRQDAQPCTRASDCCSGSCAGGVCGGAMLDASPPPPSSCTAVGSTSCDTCLVSNCCPQLAACEQNAECTNELTCFSSCDHPGVELGCEEMCKTGRPSMQGDALLSCTMQLCAAACQ